MLNKKFPSLFNILHQSNLRTSHATRFKSMNKIPLIWQNNSYVVSKSYNQINLWLSYDKIIFLNHQKVPKVAKACSHSKEGGLCWLKDSSLRMQWRLIFANVIHCSRLRLWVGYFIYFKFTPVFFYLTTWVVSGCSLVQLTE